MITQSSESIVFYDIASGPPFRTYAPNPWKTRYALNFKGVPYKTEWIDLPNVKSARQKLGAAPNRVLPDGNDFYTLPVIQDHSHNGDVIGDSLEIAMYLDKVYPDGPKLLTSSSIGLYEAFNIQVDAIFTNHTPLCAHGMPFNPETAEQCQKIFEGRSGMKWEDIGVKGDARSKMWTQFKQALEALVKPYKHSTGPFLDGETPSYADIIVGAWLQFVKATVTNDEWNTVCSWHDGIWGSLFQALEKYATIV